MRAKRQDPTELFEAKVDRVSTPDGCHTWTAAVSSSGYGSFKLLGKSVSAHVAALILAGIDVQSSEDGDHRCKNPLCVRVHPEHVQALDSIINRGEFNRSKKFCAKGHPYDDENTYWRGKYRTCRECHRTQVREAYRRKRLANVPEAGPDPAL